MGELEMNVVFSSQVNDGLDWNFEAPDKMIITEGVKYDVTFKAQNNSSIPIPEHLFLMFCRQR